MTRISLFTLGLVMFIIAVLFQLIPLFLGEPFTFLTVLSSLPIFILSRIQPKAGVIAYIAAVALVSLIDFHQGLIFIFANGIVGLSLGVSRHCFCRNILVIAVSASILTITLSFLNFILKMSVFGGKLPGIMFTQLFIILSFSIGYVILYLYAANYVCRIFSKCRIKLYRNR